jgi:polyhydroxyalkanoate synthesis regulator protein
MQEQTRRNMAIFEQAMAMWSPFSPTRQNAEQASGEKTAETANPAADTKPETANGTTEIAELKAELARMQAKIERLSQNRS